MSVSGQPRRVDRELERIKSLGVVSKTFTIDEPVTPSSTSSAGTSDQNFSVTHPDTRRSSLCSDDTIETNPTQEDMPLEEQTHVWASPSSSEDPHSRIEYLEQRHADDLQLLEEAREEVAFYKQQLSQQERTMKETIQTYLEQKEQETIKIRQLSEIISKQDRLIAELEHHQPGTELQALRQELAELREAKLQLMQMITSLHGELEMSQGQTRLMMLVSTEIQNSFDKQKQQVDQHMEMLQNELREKEELLRQYQLEMPRQTEDTVIVRPRTNSTSTFGSSLCHLEEERISQLSYTSSQRSRSSIPKAVHDSRRRSSSSRRSSSTHTSTNNGSPRRSYIAKWSGTTAIPPPTPPPNDPLPPVPTIDVSRSHRSLSPPRTVPPRNMLPPGNSPTKHVSVDVASTQSASAVHATSSLRVDDWQQPRVGTKWMDDPENTIDPVRSRSSTSVSEKQRSAFWKGMKKKWIVRS
ncbi:hypothetical protein EC973_009389 [Apophysomyces ossiformis]|uniref:Uncharacterized protein n=1 Tax=Apophysomyces ossiformis TaxID=679940 RepID=A0A8H7BJW6_9FUNG|nr:hypothetical protein EC973_009389 [Apophysomyces ossiformis]